MHLVYVMPFVKLRTVTATNLKARRGLATGLLAKFERATGGDSPPCLQEEDCDVVGERCFEEFEACIASCAVDCDANGDGEINEGDEETCQDECNNNCGTLALACLGDCEQCQNAVDNGEMCGGPCEVPGFGITGTCRPGADFGECFCTPEQLDPCDNVICPDGQQCVDGTCCSNPISLCENVDICLIGAPCGNNGNGECVGGDMCCFLECPFE